MITNNDKKEEGNKEHDQEMLGLALLIMEQSIISIMKIFSHSLCYIIHHCNHHLLQSQRLSNNWNLVTKDREQDTYRDGVEIENETEIE